MWISTCNEIKFTKTPQNEKKKKTSDCTATVRNLTTFPLTTGFIRSLLNHTKYQSWIFELEMYINLLIGFWEQLPNHLHTYRSGKHLNALLLTHIKTAFSLFLFPLSLAWFLFWKVVGGVGVGKQQSSTRFNYIFSLYHLEHFCNLMNKAVLIFRFNKAVLMLRFLWIEDKGCPNIVESQILKDYMLKTTWDYLKQFAFAKEFIENQLKKWPEII